MVSSPSTVSVLNKCYICYSDYEESVNHQSSDYIQKVMESCDDTLFTEITGDEFDWKCIVFNDVVPFCQNCWRSIEKLYEWNQHQKTTENSIDSIVVDLARRVLSNRKYLKKKGVLSTSKKNPIPSSFGQGVKIEGSSVQQNIKCKMCHNLYSIGDSMNLFSLNNSTKVMESCKQYVFPELFDVGFFDWNSIPFNNFVPFCEDCSYDTKKIMDLDEKLQEIERFVTSNVDMFTLHVLKCRKSLKISGQRGFLCENDFPTNNQTNVADSVDTIDEDCKITNVCTADVYPNHFVETILQEPEPVNRTSLTF